ncbi:ABC transporter ATP-binding protein [Spirillospora sp. CA-255316]
MSTPPLLGLDRVSVRYPARGFSRRRHAPAAAQISFTIAAGETFGLVGESGSGKSTIARAIARLLPIAEGDIRLDGRSIARSRPGEHPEIQMVFQDPDASLDPRLPVTESVQEALRAQSSGSRRRRERAAELLTEVGLAEELHARRPRQLSGGQKQRVAIAHALASRPRLLIADEPVSALDVLVQAQILDLLLDLQEREHLTILLISHDLAVVNHMSDHIGVMSRGRLVEVGAAEDVIRRPADEYTRRLLAAVPGNHLDQLSHTEQTEQTEQKDDDAAVI